MCVCWNAYYSRDNKAMLSKRAITANNRKQIYSEPRDIMAAGPFCVADLSSKVGHVRGTVFKCPSTFYHGSHGNLGVRLYYKVHAITQYQRTTRYTILHTITITNTEIYNANYAPCAFSTLRT